ncbi:MAG: hypothetical protein CSA34_01935 [Desulfobulbus propionicus]|nr:MAG: hypothetical protein CSA34_01935 [Desulfobulbus propionicus]
MIRPGVEQFCASPPADLAGKRLALLSNQAALDTSLTHSIERVTRAFPGQLFRLFSPQHGFFCEKQDNMIESDHAVEPQTGLPIYSLYSETRQPHLWMLEDLDVLLIDLVDVGTRVYTFIWTVALCLQAAAATGVRVIVLDRPNPLGGLQIEGNLLTDACRSFVGMLDVPMRHGLSLGEMAELCNREMAIDARLDVIAADGWQRQQHHPATGLPWIFPSPNMPTYETALVYPGQVLWEGTTLSEGRGTTLPFELFGAPWLDPRAVLAALQTPLPGCLLRPLTFSPTSGKHSGTDCGGLHLHVTDPDEFLPYRTSLALLQVIRSLYPEHFAYKAPPYEYEFERLPMDLIIGDVNVREALEQGVDLLEIEASWQKDLAAYRERIAPVLLYD